VSIFKKIRGTIETIFSLGIDGPNLKANGAIVEIRNAADSDYAVLRAGAPVGDDDVVNKLYADTLQRPMIVSRQADCSVSLPNNTAVRGWVVVTTAGSGAAIGDVLWDDGSSTGTMTIYAAEEGRTIAVTDSLTGGTISFEADSLYIWDADTSAWLKISDIGSVTGAMRVVQFDIDNTASQDSTFQIPASNVVHSCEVIVETPYSAGATIQVGDTATANKYQDTTDNKATKAGTYIVDQNTDTILSVVRVAVGGAPAAGAGKVVVIFSNPNG
jgi:hypothetical protein